MRWFVLLLIAANAALVVWFSVSAPETVRSVDEGRLPRVAEIELIGLQNEEEVLHNESRSPPAPDKTMQRSVKPSPQLEPESEREPEPEPNEISGPALASSASCFGVGWFEDKEGAEAYRSEKIGRQANLRYQGLTERREPLEPFHWVIIPPMDSRQVALDRYRELVELGVEAYVVPSGERENAISLGLFRSMRSAENILQRRQAQNINAILVKFPRNRISYALVFGGALPKSLGELGDTSGPGEDGRQLIEFSDCEGVATAKKNP